MVEFALILPVLLTLIFGMIELSVFLYNKQILTNAAREGARTGILMRKVEKDGSRIASGVTGEDKTIKDKVEDVAKDHLITFGSYVFGVDPGDIILTRSSFTFGSALTVEVGYKYDFLFLSYFMGPIEIKASSTMRME
jgi:CBS domain containing-hemolysin-like protein